MRTYLHYCAMNKEGLIPKVNNETFEIILNVVTKGKISMLEG